MTDKPTIPERMSYLENRVEWLTERDQTNTNTIIACQKKIAELIDVNNQIIMALRGDQPEEKKQGIITSLH